MHRSISALVLGASLVSACGGGDDAVTIDGLGDYIINTRCGIQVQCNDAVDAATCKAGFQLMGMDAETIIADVKSGIIKYDEAKAKACFEGFKADGCNFIGLHTDPEDPCNGYLTGTVATGGACFFDQECANRGVCNATSTTCDSSTTCCPGTCAIGNTGAPVALGGMCKDTNQCPIDGYCKGATSTVMGMCAPVITSPGAACDDLFACANNMICDVQTANTCYKPGPTDGACDPTFFASAVACSDERQYCDTASKKCIARVAVGATCSNTILCEGLASCVNTKCVANATAGAACDNNNMTAPSCIQGLSCTNAKCVLPASGPSCR